jgi:hypothetical protein
MGRLAPLMAALALLLPAGSAIAQTTPADSEVQPAQPPGAPAARPKAGQTAPKPRKSKRIAHAEAFASLLQEAILLEVKAQNYERKTLGAQDIERLGGILLKRRQRIDADIARFKARLSAVSMEPLILPAVPKDAELSTKEQLALNSLATVYEHTRDSHGLKAYMEANQSFLSSVDWGDRDRAVRLRDTIIDREAKILKIAAQAREILRGGKEPAEVEQMITMLRRMAPEILSWRTDVSALVLKDDEIRHAVAKEAKVFLETPTVSSIPEEDSDTLVSRLPSLQINLVQASNLSDLREELTVIEVEIEDIDARLADRGVNSLSPTERDEKTSRWKGLTHRQTTLQRQWMRTPPAQPELDELFRAQDDVIRRSLYELGHRGALFAHRCDAQRSRTEISLQSSYSTWQLIEEQASLIHEMDEARPAPGPLDGLPPRLDPHFVKSQVDLVMALKKTRPDMFDRLPEPRKTKNITVRSGKASGTSTAGRKKKSGGRKNKKKGRGRR